MIHIIDKKLEKTSNLQKKFKIQILMAIWFFYQLPLTIIQPVFFADPMGAIAGKYLTQKYGNKKNWRWNGEKTIGGTLAVFFTAFLSLTFGSWVQKLLLSFLIALVEGLSHEYDNLGIAAVVICGWGIISQN